MPSPFIPSLPSSKFPAPFPPGYHRTVVHIYLSYMCVCIYIYCCCCIVRIIYTFWIIIPYQIHNLQVILPILWVKFSLWWLCPQMNKSLISMKSNLFLVYFLYFWCHIQWIVSKFNVIKFPLMLSSKSVGFLASKFRSLVYSFIQVLMKSDLA